MFEECTYQVAPSWCLWVQMVLSISGVFILMVLYTIISILINRRRRKNDNI